MHSWKRKKLNSSPRLRNFLTLTSKYGKRRTTIVNLLPRQRRWRDRDNVLNFDKRLRRIIRRSWRRIEHTFMIWSVSSESTSSLTAWLRTKIIELMKMISSQNSIRWDLFSKRWIRRTNRWRNRLRILLSSQVCGHMVESRQEWESIRKSYSWR